MRTVKKPLEARPFVKWVGGKTQLLAQLVDLLPKQIDTYYEPFTGGAALFYHLANLKRFEHAVLNDWNEELINAYRVVRDFPAELLEQVAKLTISKECFLQLRKVDPKDLSPVRRAARTLYLNKTGYNGLFRVNKKGGFNVPWGKYKNPTIADPNIIRLCSEALNQYATLYSGDFVTCTKNAKSGDLVYFDPPYVPLNATSNFQSYTSEGFTLNDQRRLAILFRELVDRGVAVIASNSNTQIVRDLYADFEQYTVDAKRNVNSKGSQRGPIKELIIVGRKRFLPAIARK